MLGSSKRNNSGFTLPEVMVSLVMMGVLLIGILAIIMNYYTLIIRNNISIDMTVASQNLLRSTVEELRYGAGVRQTNTIPDSHAPATGWNTTNDNFVIIIATPAVDSDNDYITNVLTGLPYNNELVYYKEGNRLYKRSLAHPDASNNSLTTSCPAASASATCPADTLLLEHTKDMVFSLYDQDDVSVTDPLLARSVKIDLHMSRETFGSPLVLDNSIRVTLRNQL